MAAGPVSPREAAHAAGAPTPPFRMGDFAYVEDRKKYDLVYCPLCAVDPGREHHRFELGDCRPEHFLEEHGPEDVGQAGPPLLLPD